MKFVFTFLFLAFICQSYSLRLVKETNQLDAQTMDSADLEALAFQNCDLDSDDGLSWTEVEKCENQYCKTMHVADCPTKADFEDFDHNNDGILTWLEWEAGKK